MKVGDKVEVVGIHGERTPATVLEILDKSARVKIEGIGGSFIFLKTSMEIVHENR